ncbi:MAG: hypothetical protein PSV13_19825 [Lacunisphaera sp.]|nr:hypothetical protein [Lacunisphaera sp.]
MYTWPSFSFRPKECFIFTRYVLCRTSAGHLRLVDIRFFHRGCDTTGHLFYLAVCLQRRFPGEPVYVSVLGGSSYGADISVPDTSALIRRLLVALKVKHAIVGLHYCRSGRLDYHILALNADGEGRLLVRRLRWFRKAMRASMRRLVTGLNTERLEQGRPSIANLTAQGRVFFVDRGDDHDLTLTTAADAPAPVLDKTSTLTPESVAAVQPAPAAEMPTAPDQPPQKTCPEMEERNQQAGIHLVPAADAPESVPAHIPAHIPEFVSTAKPRSAAVKPTIEEQPPSLPVLPTPPEEEDAEEDRDKRHGILLAPAANAPEPAPNNLPAPISGFGSAAKPAPSVVAPPAQDRPASLPVPPPPPEPVIVEPRAAAWRRIIEEERREKGIFDAALRERLSAPGGKDRQTVGLEP